MDIYTYVYIYLYIYAHRQSIAPMCDDTAFANDVDVRIQGVGLELNDENKKRVRKLIRARNGRNEFDRSRANIERARRSVLEPPQPTVRKSEVKLNKRPMDHSPPRCRHVERALLYSPFLLPPRHPPYIKFIHETR